MKILLVFSILYSISIRIALCSDENFDTFLNTAQPGPQQVFQLWTSDNENCTGPANFVTNDSANLTVTSANGTMYYRLIGLWVYRVWVDSQNFNVASGYPYTNDRCNKVQVSIMTYNRLQLTRHGDSYQQANEIHFFTSNYFGGTEHIVGEDGVERLDIVARSWFFTGVNRWGVTDFCPSFNCFNYTTAVGQNGYGTTFSHGTRITVDKVTFGC